jgi:NAD(P)-dependent dehydrogenase (short-subunit alcohol dehydrogenase family)
MDDLQGRVAVVTGAASGIGRALAERFLAEGMSVAMADIETDALQAAAASLEGRGVILTVPTDVSDPRSVDDLARTVRERFGTFHVVCNNAGVGGHFGRTWEAPLEEWRWLFDVNTWGVIHGIRSFVPTLIEQGLGHVVNTASMAAWRGAPALGPYCATKHAVLAISDSLRVELEEGGSGVGVSVVCPGVISTRISTSERNWPGRLGAQPGFPDDELSIRMRERLRVGTTTGGEPPSDVAEAVVEAIRLNRFVVTNHVPAILESMYRRLEVSPAAAGPVGNTWTRERSEP